MPWKVILLLNSANFTHSLNNNSLTAQVVKETKVAMVAGWTKPSNMLKVSLLKLRINIHMRLMMTLAELTHQRVLPRSLISRMSLPTMLMNSRLLLKLVQFQSLLRLTLSSSNSTAVVSSTMLAAVLNLTTVSSLLVTETTMAKTTSSLRTHGVLHGEKRDMLESPPHQTISAVSSLNHHTQSWLNHEHVKFECNTLKNDLLLIKHLIKSLSLSI